MRRGIWIVAVLILILTFAPACNDSGEKTKDDPAAKIRGEKDRELAEAETYVGPKASYGDTVVVNVFVNLPKYLYLNGPKPLRIMIPGNTPFKFSKNEYFVKKPIFPLKLDFTFDRKIKTGIHKIPLAARLMYCNKADDICLIKNIMVELEFMVISRAGTVPQKIYITKNIQLE